VRVQEFDVWGVEIKSMSDQLRKIADTSPALGWQSDKPGEFAYPANFRGRVPLKVKLAVRVLPDLPFVPAGTVAEKDHEYYVWVNSYGAVSAILPNGEKLGLRPEEFDVVEWHEKLQWVAEMDKGDEDSDDQFWRVRWSEPHPKHGWWYAAHYGGNGSQMNRAMAERNAERWNEEKKPPFI
jgi:hypothetical protein